jgi:hypothetical protein
VELPGHELVTSAQIAALLDGSIDVAFLRDGDPAEGIRTIALFTRRVSYVWWPPGWASLWLRLALQDDDRSRH